MDKYTVTVYNSTMVMEDRVRLMKQGWFWSFWCLGDNPNGDPFAGFANRYGYAPTEALVGQSNINIPDNVKVLGSTTKGHIALR